MNPLIYQGKVTENGLHIIHRSRFDEEIKQFFGKDVVIKVERKKKRRSLSQNAYLHAMFTEFTQYLNELGNTFDMEQVKDMCKCKFLKVHVYNEQTGEVIGESIRHTHKLTTVELATFIDEVHLWAMEFFGIKLHLPGEQIEIE